MRSFILLGTLAASGLITSARPVEPLSRSSSFVAREPGSLLGDVDRPDIKHDLKGNTGFPQDATLPFDKRAIEYAASHQGARIYKRALIDDEAYDHHINRGALDEDDMPQTIGDAFNKRASPLDRGKHDKKKGGKKDDLRHPLGDKPSSSDGAHQGADDARNGGTPPEKVTTALDANHLPKNTEEAFHPDRRSVNARNVVDESTPPPAVKSALDKNHFPKDTDEAFHDNKRNVVDESTPPPAVKSALDKNHFPQDTDEAFHQKRGAVSHGAATNVRKSLVESRNVVDESKMPSEVSSALDKNNFPKDTDEAFHHGEKRNVVDETKMPAGVKTALDKNHLPATTEEAFGKRGTRKTSLPIVNELPIPIKRETAGVSARDIPGLKGLAGLMSPESIPGVGSLLSSGVVDGGIKGAGPLGSLKRDNSKYMKNGKLPL